jgi:hypothetical protein
LAGEDVDTLAVEIARVLIELEPTPDDKRQARIALSRLLDPNRVRKIKVAELLDHPSTLVHKLLQFDPTRDDKRQSLGSLLSRLSRENDEFKIAHLARATAALNPTVSDLGGWREWPWPPHLEVLAAARRNSELGDWLGMIPLLADCFEKFPSASLP